MSSAKSLTIPEITEILDKLDIRYIICDNLIYCIYYCINNNKNIFSTAIFILYSIEINDISCNVNVKFIHNCSRDLKTSIIFYIKNALKKDERRVFSRLSNTSITQEEIDKFNIRFVSKISTRIYDMEYFEDFLRIINTSNVAIEELKKSEINVINLFISNFLYIRNQYTTSIFEKVKDSYTEELIERRLNDINIQITYILHAILILIQDLYFLKKIEERDDKDEFCKILLDESVKKEEIGTLLSRDFAKKILLKIQN